MQVPRPKHAVVLFCSVYEELCLENGGQNTCGAGPGSCKETGIAGIECVMIGSAAAFWNSNTIRTVIKTQPPKHCIKLNFFA